MINTPGSKPIIIVGDTDGLIALLYEKDKHFNAASAIADKLIEVGAQVIFPLTTIVETTTTLHRKYNQPRLAAVIAKQIINGDLIIEEINNDTLQKALVFYNPQASKKKTLFDAIVAAVAKKYGASAIFSFDNWYKDLGFKLAGELI